MLRPCPRAGGEGPGLWPVSGQLGGGGAWVAAQLRAPRDGAPGQGGLHLVHLAHRHQGHLAQHHRLLHQSQLSISTLSTNDSSVSADSPPMTTQVGTLFPPMRAHLVRGAPACAVGLHGLAAVLVLVVVWRLLVRLHVLLLVLQPITAQYPSILTNHKPVSPGGAGAGARPV